jgi:hypothetical protein
MGGLGAPRSRARSGPLIAAVVVVVGVVVIGGSPSWWRWIAFGVFFDGRGGLVSISWRVAAVSVFTAQARSAIA